MRRKLIIIGVFMVAITCRVFAQKKVVADFETLHPIEMNGWDEQPEVVANPKSSGIDTSNNVLSWRKSSGEWKAFMIAFDDVTVAETPVFKFKFYSPVTGALQARIENETESEAVYVNVKITEPNKWVDYTADITALLKGKKYNKVFFFINSDKANDESTYYLDDVLFSKK